MATRIKSDELNIVGSEQIVEHSNILSIDDFFDTMYLTDSEKEERKDFAKAIFSVLSVLLTIVLAKETIIKANGGEHDTQYYEDYIKDNLLPLYREVFGSDKFSSQIDTFASEFVETTIRNIGKKYFTSDDRAIVNAEQQTNATFNRDEYEKAVDSGKTQKMWITKHDMRVRHTHVEADGQTVAIDKPFEVGGCELRFPCDPLGSAKEIVNCRCQVIYTGLPKEDIGDSENN